MHIWISHSIGVIQMITTLATAFMFIAFKVFVLKPLDERRKYNLFLRAKRETEQRMRNLRND